MAFPMLAAAVAPSLLGGGGASGPGSSLTGGTEDVTQTAESGGVTVNAGGLNLPVRGFFDQPAAGDGVPLYAVGIAAMVALLAVLVLVKR